MNLNKFNKIENDFCLEEKMISDCNREELSMKTENNSEKNNLFNSSAPIIFPYESLNRQNLIENEIVNHFTAI